jgi:hypothetical protein
MSWNWPEAQRLEDRKISLEKIDAPIGTVTGSLGPSRLLFGVSRVVGEVVVDAGEGRLLHIGRIAVFSTGKTDDHVQVDAGDVLRVLDPDAGGDHRTPVTFPREVPVVSQPGHERRPSFGGLLDSPPCR